MNKPLQPTDEEIGQATINSVPMGFPYNGKQTLHYYIITDCETKICSLSGRTLNDLKCYLRSDGNWYAECTMSGFYHSEQQAKDFLQKQTNK